MYSTQRLEVPVDIKMQRMYSMKSTPNGESNMSHMPNAKKENMFQSVLTAFNSFIWESFSKVPGSFMANINNPLSVTVVPNEGIISHEFFKSLTSRKEQLTTNNMYIHNMSPKESLRIIDEMHCPMFDENTSFLTGNFNKNIQENFKFDQIIQRSDDKELIMKESIDKCEKDTKLQRGNTLECPSVQHTNLEKEAKSERVECTCSEVTCKVHTAKQLYDSDTKSTSVDEGVSDFVDASLDSKSFIDDEYTVIFSSEDDENQSENSVKQTAISTMFLNMWQRVVGRVTDRLYVKTDVMNPVASAKRSISPKQRRKLNTVAKGRGRGRAKSQLRRSGVSQTRHRKERTKHDLVVDIQDDFECWQDFEIYHAVKNNESVDCCSLDETDTDLSDAPEFITHESASPMTFTFADVKPRKRKPKSRKIIDQDVSNFSTRVRYVPECTVEANSFHKDYNDIKYDSRVYKFRPRLISESSVDSEDSYCIVFEADSETSYKSDFDNDVESDDDQSTEDEESARPMQKVKFNLKPIVHVMIQWDYAYRAARRGPWEEMARDRERFRSRINCIERVLNPILTKQHRAHIWQERFALEE